MSLHSLELKIPPLAVGGMIALLMWLVARSFPPFAFAFEPMRKVAVGVALAGVAITGLAALSFRKAHTTVNPMKPSSTSSLVTSGIYRYTRNPMYLGFFLALIAWGLYLSNVLALLVLTAFILYMNRFQIEPEERALTVLFGQEFVQYTSRVRRWL